MAVAQAVQSVTSVLDPFWGARLGEGVISAMGYSNRFLGLLLGMGAVAIGRAMLPVFSLLGRDAALRYRLCRQWALGLFALGVACAAAMWISAPLSVRLIFERGAFSAADTARVAELLRWGLLQLPFYFGGLVWVSLLSAARGYQLLFFAALGSLCVKFIGNEAASRFLGVDGLYLATACMYCFSFFFLWFLARRTSTLGAAAIRIGEG
jgi:peptidoglycan biosynthesis protein MviN/MurJ (putative lipid II flippase)